MFVKETLAARAHAWAEKHFPTPCEEEAQRTRASVSIARAYGRRTARAGWLAGHKAGRDNARRAKERR